MNFVVVVDTQYDFMMPDGILYVPGAEETIVPITHYLANLNSKTTLGVLFTFDTHVKEIYEASPEADMFPLHCELGTKGHRNVINAKVIDSDIYCFNLEKPVFDMWATNEIVRLDHLALDNVETHFNNVKNQTDVDIIDVIGVALNFCVKQAVDGFLERGFKVRLHPHLTRGIDTGKPGDLDANILYAEEIKEGKVEIARIND